MLLPLNEWVLAAVLASVIAVAAYRLRSLSTSGMIAAIALGTIVVGTGGWWAGTILVVFFVTSSVFSKLSRTTEPQARGSRRDWVQVLANGWGLMVGCVLWAITGWAPWFLFGIGALAAATADTWSSEIGRTSTSLPRIITTLKPVSPGTSGAISARGTLASLAGAALIGGFAAIAVSQYALDEEIAPLVAFILITLAGVVGGLLDSFLGATIQERRWCDSCNKPTEAILHHCGTSTRHIGGVQNFDNDVVNALCGVTGALIGLVSSIL